LLLLVYCSSIISLVAPRCDSVRGASRAFATIEIRTAQTIAKIRNGHRAKSDEVKFDRLRAKAKIGNNELSITKNASILLCSSLIDRMSKLAAPPIDMTGRAGARAIPNGTKRMGCKGPSADEGPANSNSQSNWI